MKCQAIQKLLPLFLEGALERKEAESVNQHITACPACQKELHLYRQSWEMLKDLKDIEPSRDYMSRFWTRVSLETSPVERFMLGLKTLIPARQVMAMGIALSMIVMMFVVGGQHVLEIKRTNAALAKITPDEFELVADKENFELAKHFDVIEDIDFLKDLDVVENLDSLQLESSVETERL